MPAWDSCQFCSSWNMISMGIGTEGVYEELTQKISKKTPIDIIDGSHNTKQKELNDLLEAFHNSTTASIIVGTKKAIPLLDDIDLIVVVSLAPHFAAMSYNTIPNVVELLVGLQEKTTNPIALQCRNTSELIEPLLNQELYGSYISRELAELEAASAAPFGTVVKIERSLKKEVFKKIYQTWYQIFKDYEPDIVTRPGDKKGFIHLIFILHLPLSLWNRETQDRKIKTILESLPVQTQIGINPQILN